MKINKLYDDVYEVENFLNEEEFSKVINLINSIPEEKWFEESLKDKLPEFWYGKQIFFEEKNILDEINKKMKNLFVSFSYYPDGVHLQRYKINEHIQHHRDQWIPDLDYYIGYGFCLYFNDDYEGGELDYPELNLTFKPKANALYIHGGHILHGSLPVTNDKVRYFTTVFIRGTKDLPTKLNPELFN